jgi:hemerythrin-like domain-containing protein
MFGGMLATRIARSELMFDWLTSENHAVAILKKDHEKVKELFDQFEKEKSGPAKKKIIEQALNELKVHAVLEEEIFYPTVRKQVGEDLMNEADEEHHVAKLLIAELENLKNGDSHRDAKFTVLAENVRHHIKEEENEVMPKAKDMRVDFEKLGAEMLRRKAKLQAEGVPPTAEDKLIANNPKSDSPAAASARRKAPRLVHNGHKSAPKRGRAASKKR